jgi:hypothetical protein
MPPSPQQGVSTEVSLPHLYWHLLMWQNHLDQAAADHEKAGKNGTWLRTHLETELGFNDVEFASVRRSAQYLQGKLAAIDAQAHAIMRQRQSLLFKSESDLPPDPRLKDLTRQREDTINNEIVQMNTALGPVDSKRLKDFVEQVFVKNVRVVTIQPQLLKSGNFDFRTAHQEVQP